MPEFRGIFAKYNNLEAEPDPEKALAAIFERYAADMARLKESHQFDTREDWALFFEEITAAKNNAVQQCPIERFRVAIETAYSVAYMVILQEIIDDLKMKAENNNQCYSNDPQLTRYLFKAAKWQSDIFLMINTMIGHGGGEKFIRAVWDQHSDISGKRAAFKGGHESAGVLEAEQLKNGILSLRLANWVLKFMLRDTDAVVLLPTPEEDVQEQTDLKIVRTGVVCVVQVKSSAGGLGEMEVEDLDEFQPENNLTGRERRSVVAKNKLLRKIIDEHIANKALWLIVTGSKGSGVNQTTGEPTLEYLQRHAQGEFRDTIFSALGLEVKDTAA